MRQGLIATEMLVTSLVLAVGMAGASPVEQRGPIDTAFRAELERLAAKCDELQMADEARHTRQWAAPRDAKRQTVFLAETEDISKPGAGANDLANKWYARFLELRRTHAQALFDLARKQATDGNEAGAYRLLHEVLRDDPDHEAARRALEFERRGNRWQRPGARAIARRVSAPHPIFGWRRYWKIETDHFWISTTLSGKAGLELGRELETLFAVWQQLFFEYWCTPGALKARIDGLDRSLGADPDTRFGVVLFRDREQYIDELSRVEPRISQSDGYYLPDHKLAFLIAGDLSLKARWYHEATHQFFQEAGQASDLVGEDSNYWIVEGIALYMESLRDRDGVYTVGGFDADRLQFARYRALNESYYVPLTRFVTLGRETVQADEDIGKLYSQAAGLTHFLMDGDRGVHRAKLVEYLRQVYRGESDSTTMTKSIPVALSELDQRYRDFLVVHDDDLRFIGAANEVKNLCLGHCQVTDQGLVHLDGLDQLEWLDLSFTTVSDPGIERLQAARNLTQLNLERTGITDAALPVVAGFRQLEVLDLSGTQVTDTGVARLGRLVNLAVLWLTRTQITNSSLESLSVLRDLETFDVTGTAVSDEALDRFRKRMPKLRK